MTTNSTPTFTTVTGGTGKVTTDFGGQQDYANSVALQADGKILVAGDSGSGTAIDFALVRYNADGSLDTTFAGTGGFLQNLFGNADYATSVLVQADGKIVVAGYANTGTTWNFAAVRYNANGTLDTGYGSGGAIGVDIGGGADVSFAAALQADGKVVLTGYTLNATGTSKFAVVRLTTAGKIDTTFNGSGAATGSFGGTKDAAQAVAVQADGKIVVAGYTSNDNVSKDIALVRYNANGTVDTTFGSGGGVTTSFAGSEDVAMSVKVQPDGKILVAGYSNARGHMDFVIVRYNANGSYDTTFGNGGALQVDFGWDPVSGYTYDHGYSVTLQDDGRIVVVGATGDGWGNDVGVARFNTDGSADTTFGGTGKVTARFNGDYYGNDVARSVTIQPDGQIVVAGYVQSNGSSDFGVLRFHSDGSLDMRFGGVSANTLGSSVSYTENDAAVVVDGTVKVFDLEMSRLNFGAGNYAGATLTLARSGGASAEDVFSGSGSLVLSAGAVKLGTTTIGSYTQADGVLTITFNANATQSRVDQALSAIAYANTSDAPPTTVQLTWTFSDGTSSGTGTSTVNITRVNDPATGYVTIEGTLVVGQVLSVHFEVADADGRELNGESWQWRADGVDIAGANGRNYTLTAADAGKTITAVLRYTDFGGTVDGLVSAPTAAVAPYNSAPTFTAIVNGTGKLLTDIAGSKQDYAEAVSLQADGGILVAGTTFGTTRDMVVVRYTADGVLDTTFSGTGKVLTSFGTSTHDHAYSIAQHTAGFFLVAGSTEPVSGGNADFLLVRHQYGGALDSVFAGGGKVAVDFGGTQDYARVVATQADGKIVVAGNTSLNGNDFALARFNANGTLDTSFNTTGKLTTNIGAATTTDYVYGMALQGDGRIVVVGSSSAGTAAATQDFAVVRYNGDGSLDTTFNGSGRVITAIGTGHDTARGVAVQRDGKIVVAGFAQNSASMYDVAVVRYNTDGSLDTGFGSAGKVMLDLSSGSHDYGHAVAILGDGKILVSGRSGADGNDMALLRLNTDGSLDTSFNGTGKANTGFGSWTADSAEALAVQGDGRVVLAGTSSAATNDFAVARYNADGTLDKRFAGTPVNTLDATASYVENAAPVALDSSVTVYDTELVARGNYAGAVFILDEVLSTQDVFSAVGRLTLAGGDATLAGTVIGTYTPANARLEITFNENATQARVNEALSSLAYASTSDNPGATATLRWTLTDGGGPTALIGGGITRVNVTRVNDAPTGSVTVSGDAMQGGVLTASHTLADAEGLGTLSWQWLENGLAIAGANSASLTLTSAQVGKAISVRASYTDGAGTPESVTSAATAAVTPPNNAPTGSVDVVLPAGATAPRQGDVLTVGNTLADADGMGPIAWQWLAGGEVIAGANGSTFAVTQAQVGKAMTVRATYTDGTGFVHAVSSASTAAVVNVNDTPTGNVTVSGTARQGQTLTAANTLGDMDGLGTVSYQWLADGSPIGGATASSLVLGQGQVGKTISVRASYTDGQGTPESVTSGATAVVANVNDPVTGGVTIGGTAAQGQTLVASHTLADVDGLGSVAYQWLANGAVLQGATGSTLTLGQAHVGKTISVRASYTDGQGTAESATSTATAAVLNVNDAPTGTLAISGHAIEGQMLLATSTIADADGMAAVQYQWRANGVDIAGANGTSYTLTAADVGSSITVALSYTDLGGTAERVVSAGSGKVVANSAPTFAAVQNGTGKVLTNIAASQSDTARAVAVQSDGGILVAGTTGGTTRDFAVTRYTRDGALDTAFGTGGKVVTDLGTGTNDDAQAIAVQADGSFLVVGHTSSASTGSGHDLALVRYRPDGTLDTTFNGTGRVVTDFGLGEEGYAVAVQGDGKIVVAGTTGQYSVSIALARYNTNGTLDTSFNGTGKVTTDFGTGSNAWAHAMAIQADGRIVVTGTMQGSTGNQEVAVVRYNTNGTLDTTFNGSGKVFAPVGAGHDFARAIVVQPDGKIVVAGGAETASGIDVAVLRFNSDGSLDTTFAGSGKATFDLHAGAPEQALALTLQADGKLVIAGGANAWALLRLNADGSLDTSFNGTGKVRDTQMSMATAATVQGDGRIVVAGFGFDSTGSHQDFAVARYKSDGSLDNSFAGTPTTTLGGIVAYTENAAAVTIDSTVALHDAELAALASGAGNYAGSSLTLQRVGGASAQDVFSGTGTLVLAGGDATLGGVVIGTVTQQAGTLTLAFNDNATQARVNQALSSIAYANASDLPPTSVQLQWTFAESTAPGAKTAAGTSTVNITRVNDAPTGTAAISGTATQGAVLTANHTLADADGLGTIGWQWLAGGTPIAGANGSTFTLTSAQVGKTITVRATYTDGAGTAENVTSAATTSVTPPNTAPTGTVSIGMPAASPRQGDVLTAGHTLADPDGVGTVGWQWLADGNAIAGANANTFTLTQAQVGKSISVRASYTDGFGTQESVTSTATALVANVNDAPTGGVTISGTAQEDQTLTASNTLADADGVGAIQYQWLANGAVLQGATGSSLVLTQAHVGQTLSVRASYTDGQGTSESASSAATAAVANANDAPTGGLVISGTVQLGRTIQVTDSIDDEDGRGTVLYQWYADGQAIAGATGSTLSLLHAQVSKSISVTGRYVDGFGTQESVSSAPTAKVANDPGIGISLTGTPAADVLVGTGGNDTLVALAGQDYLYGGSGNDTLYGGDGIDVLLGEDGDDVIHGDGGQDYLFGGSGNDTMHGGDGIDVFTADGGNDVLYGGAGEVDHFYVESGNNTVYGEAGVDILVGGVDADVYYGGADNDYAYAGAGNDSLYGGDGVDVLLGEAGDDFFDPGAGVDYLYMGAGGNDTVLVNATTSGISLLYEFEIGGTNDKVRLQGTGWSSLADVVAHTYDYGSFSIVQVDADTAIWIIGAVPSQFTAVDFQFS